MDRIIETAEGYNCIVNGRIFGTWRSRAEAVAGMATEQRRATEHATKNVQTKNNFVNIA